MLVDPRSRIVRLAGERRARGEMRYGFLRAPFGAQFAAAVVKVAWIARRRSLNWINVAFFRLNAVVSMVFLGVVVAEIVFQGWFKLR